MELKKGILHSILWRGLFIFTSLLLNIFLVRYLGAGESGTLFYIITLLSFFIQISGLSLESGLGYFAANNEIPAASLAAFCLLLTTTIFVIALGLSNFTGFDAFDLDKHSGSLEYVFFVFGNLLFTYFSTLFSAKLDFMVPNLIGSLLNILLVGFLFYLLYFDGGFIEKDLVISLFYYSFLIRAFLLVVVFFATGRNRKPLRLPAMRSLTRLFKYCLAAYVANIIFFVLYRIDYFFVEKYCSPEDLGIYMQVSKVAQMFFIIPSMIAGVIFALTASDSKERTTDVLTGIGRITFYLYFVFCILLAITGSWLFPMLFGADFGDMHQPFVLLIPGIIALAMIYPITAYFAGSNKISINIKGSFLALVVILAGDLLFIPEYGISAAAAVSSMGYITFQVYVLKTFKKGNPIQYNHFFKFHISDYVLLAKVANQIVRRNEAK